MPLTNLAMCPFCLGSTVSANSVGRFLLIEDEKLTWLFQSKKKYYWNNENSTSQKEAVHI